MPEGSEDGYYNITLTADGQILGVTFEPESAHPIAERRDVEPLAARQLPINGYRCLDQPRLNAGLLEQSLGRLHQLVRSGRRGERLLGHCQGRRRGCGVDVQQGQHAQPMLPGRI